MPAFPGVSDRRQNAAAKSRPSPIVPVLLSGGWGSRLWPLARRDRPKQMLRFGSEATLVEQTLLRVARPERFGSPLVVANADHRAALGEQIGRLGLEVTAILEPLSRDTAAAAAVAALHVSRETPDALLLLMPADHTITDVDAFHAAIIRAATAAEGGKLALFAVPPTHPATGYGYLRLSAAERGGSGVRGVERFVEKPDRDTAEAWLADSRYYWNSGIFLIRAETLLDEMRRHVPEIVQAMSEALDGAGHEHGFLHLAPAPLAACPAISLDRAVMERSDRLVATILDAGWRDLGSWSALWEFGPKDEAGNVLVGEAVAVDARGCYLHSEGPMIAVLGVEDLVITATSDAVLVASRRGDQAVRRLAEARGRAVSETDQP